MATCPRCLGPLTDDHQCPRGRSWHGLLVAATMLAGGLLGLAICYTIVDRPHAAVVLAAAVLGAILANALRQAMRSGI